MSIQLEQKWVYFFVRLLSATIRTAVISSINAKGSVQLVSKVNLDFSLDMAIEIL